MSRPSMGRAASLSSTSSFSSISSISDTNIDTDVDLQSANAKPHEIKRTRKRFSQEQLIVLEQAYHKYSHPTREKREQIAKQADMSVKSVTIWFQNKRQAERKLSQNKSTDRNAPPSVAMNPLHASATQLTSTNPPSHPITLTSQPTKSQSRLPTRTASGFLSLDRIASRTERVPRTPTKLTRHISFYEYRCRSSEGLWDSMLSSPIQPERDNGNRDGQESPSTRDYLDFASARRRGRGSSLRGRRTLEWACAAARMATDKEDDGMDATELDGPLPKLSFDIDNEADDDASTEIVDTEMESLEDSHEAITPDASQIMFEDDTSPTLKVIQLMDEATPDENKIDHAVMNIDTRGIEKDSELLDAAWVLCGLSTLRR